MRQSLVDQIAKHMEKVAPAEGCGFIVRSGKTGRGERFIPVENMLDSEMGQAIINSENDPDAAFLIDPAVYIKHSRNIKYIVHSHVHELEVEVDEPSGADLVHQRATAVPWIIFVIENGSYKTHYKFGDGNA